MTGEGGELRTLRGQFSVQEDGAPQMRSQGLQDCFLSLSEGPAPASRQAIIKD